MAAGKPTFLTYDNASLLEFYRDEAPISGAVPYVELASFLCEPWAEMPGQAAHWTILKEAEPFQLALDSPPGLGRLQTSVYQAFVQENRVDRGDSEVVRLESYDDRTRTFSIRRCQYSDGLRSNYAMDWQGETFSLRSLITQDYGAKLPPLGERRLSNALGVAAIVWYRTREGDLQPYLPRRAHSNATRQTVFQGGYHCTASGEAAWRPSAATFDEMFTLDICRELHEEVGLRREDLDWIVPVSLCREFLRGGKPQLFFVGLAKVEADELGPRRREAIQQQILRGRQEVMDDYLRAESPAQLQRDLALHGTVESIANMFYAQRCIELAGRGIMPPGEYSGSR